MTNHQTYFGPQLIEGGVHFALWGPAADHVLLELDGSDGRTRHAMSRNDAGWHLIDVRGAQAGDRYSFILPDGQRVPDPASRFNPDDVHQASQVVDSAHEWQHPEWRGRPWTEAVVYEMHVGAFTPEGTFRAAQERLVQLQALGVTAIELMPLAAFPGQRNWGYDGALLFAPDASYGTPRELRDFIDAAHGLGLMVLLDVVYNHFGPEGNYLPVYCPPFFNPAHQTPWGAAINFDGEHSRSVRDFFVQNALYWVEEFRFDGLRMDAVHAIRDDSDVSIVREICAEVQAGPGSSRHVHIVLENEANQASLLERSEGRPHVATAQWNDDFHHAVHVLSTGETEGYYADYEDAPVELFARSLAEGFIYQGQASAFLKGRHRGESSAHLPSGAFVSFLQTHDQIGNRALGERIHALGDLQLIRAARVCLLLSPHIPMFFMGEEYAASTPFQFFSDFGPELAQAITEGRRKEFSHFGAFSGEGRGVEVPDPNAKSTFEASKLRWSEREQTMNSIWLGQAQALLALRRELLVPLLSAQREGGQYRTSRDSTVWVDWTFPTSDAIDTTAVKLGLVAHFGDTVSAEIKQPAGRVVYSLGAQATGTGAMTLDRGGVHVTLRDLTRD